MIRISKIDKAKLELKYIEKSKEVDKFDYNVRLRVMLAMYGGFFGLLIVGLSTEIKGLAIIMGITLVLFPLIFAIYLFYPITKEFKAKRKMERSRYDLLGMNSQELDKELKETLNNF
ncbi:MAG: hypothetical protein PF542_04485 [Nanoarchaeota archaeon]|jgi:Ca2+/Na+ antiporter|nr:hypothetical protein [Nanoarchaeota archaeon]